MCGPACGAALSFIINTGLDTKRSRPLSGGLNRNLVTIIVVYLSHSRLSYITIISYFYQESCPDSEACCIVAGNDGRPRTIKVKLPDHGANEDIDVGNILPPHASQREIRSIGWRSITVEPV